MTAEKNNVNELINEVSEKETLKNENESMEKIDYRFFVDMIKEMEGQYKLLKDIAISQAEMQFNLTKEVYTGIIPIKKEDIDSMDINDIKDFMSKYLIEDQKLPFNNDDEIRDAMKQLKDSSLQMLSAKADIDDIKKDSSNMLKDYVNYLSTPIAQEKRAKRLQALKDSVNKTDDADKKKEMIRMINIMEEAQSLSFLFNRFNSLGKKEVKSIVDSFFDKRRGAIVVNRFKSKIVKFGFDHMLYRYFFNLEENFLDEKYRVFNNLFLFIYMRMVACSDPYSKKDTIYVQSLTSSMANLIYHRFDSTVNEENFKNIIKKVDDNFLEYYDLFNTENATHPDHPIRLEADNKRNAERRKAIIAKMEELKITGYDENASADDLQTYLNENLDKMINEQIKKKDKPSEDVDNVEHVDVDIIEPEDAISEDTSEVIDVEVNE